MTAGMHRRVGFVTGMLESELQASGLQNLWLLKDEPFLLSQKPLHFHILLVFTMFSCLLRLDLKSFTDPVFPELLTGCSPNRDACVSRIREFIGQEGKHGFRKVRLSISHMDVMKHEVV